jgi:hypothetical protein
LMTRKMPRGTVLTRQQLEAARRQQRGLGHLTAALRDSDWVCVNHADPAADRHPCAVLPAPRRGGARVTMNRRDGYLVHTESVPEQCSGGHRYGPCGDV